MKLIAGAKHINHFLFILRLRSGGSSAWQSFRASLGLMILAGGDAVDAYLWWVSPSLPGLHAETGVSQVQILPARPEVVIKVVGI